MSTSLTSNGITYGDGTTQSTAFKNLYTSSYVNGTGGAMALTSGLYYETLTVTGLPAGTYMYYCTCAYNRTTTGSQQYVGYVGPAGLGNSSSGYDGTTIMVQKNYHSGQAGTQYTSMSKSFPLYVGTGSTSLYLAGWTTGQTTVIEPTKCALYLWRLF